MEREKTDNSFCVVFELKIAIKSLANVLHDNSCAPCIPNIVRDFRRPVKRFKYLQSIIVYSTIQ